MLARGIRPGFNPVIIKELRSRMRGKRAYIALSIFLILLSLFALAVYQVAAMEANASGDIAARATIGLTLFFSIGELEMLLVCFMAPAFTMGAISGERERQTYDLLVTTLLRPFSIVTGKLFASLSYIFLMVLASMPVMSIVFLFGGITLEQFAIGYLLLLVNACTYGTLGLFFSSLMRSTLGAAILSFGTLLMLTVGSGIVTLLVNVFVNLNRFGQVSPRFIYEILYINPFFAFGTLWQDPSLMNGGIVPSWVWNVLIDTIITLLALLGAARLVRPTRLIGRARSTPART